MQPEPKQAPEPYVVDSQTGLAIPVSQASDWGISEQQLKSLAHVARAEIETSEEVKPVK